MRALPGNRKQDTGHSKDRRTSEEIYLLFNESVDSLQHPLTRELIRHVWLSLWKQNVASQTRKTHYETPAHPPGLTHTQAQHPQSASRRAAAISPETWVHNLTHCGP